MKHREILGIASEELRQANRCVAAVLPPVTFGLVALLVAYYGAEQTGLLERPDEWFDYVRKSWGGDSS